MKEKYLKSNLEKWTKEGFVSTEQAQKILSFEKDKKIKTSRLVTGFLTIGVITLLLGIISFIANNWKEIPDGVKLTVDFLILGVLGFFSFRFWQDKRLLYFESCLLAFSLFCLVSIGIISQIYHTGGDLSDALLLWSVITCGTMLFSQAKILPLLWIIGLYIGLSSSLLEVKFFFNDTSPMLFIFLPLTGVLLTIASETLFTKKELFDTERTKMFWTCVLIAFLFSFIFREAALTHDITKVFIENFLSPSYILSYFCTFIASIYLFLKPSFDIKNKFFLLTFMLSFLFPLHLVILLLGLFMLSLFFLRKGYERVFRYLLIIIQLRFLVFFIIASSGLLSTALSLMLYGSIFIIASILWNKYSLQVTHWFKRWAL